MVFGNSCVVCRVGCCWRREGPLVGTQVRPLRSLWMCPGVEIVWMWAVCFNASLGFNTSLGFHAQLHRKTWLTMFLGTEGWVTKIIRRADGKVRTTWKIYSRPVAKLIELLPIPEDAQTTSQCPDDISMDSWAFLGAISQWILWISLKEHEDVRTMRIKSLLGNASFLCTSLHFPLCISAWLKHCTYTRWTFSIPLALNTFAIFKVMVTVCTAVHTLYFSLPPVLAYSLAL